MKKPETKKPDLPKGLSYQCRFCSYVYDPSEHGGVAFEDLPADWLCPLCGVGKDDFEPIQ